MPCGHRQLGSQDAIKGTAVGRTLIALALIMAGCTASGTSNDANAGRIAELQDEVIRTKNDIAALANDVERLESELSHLREAQTAAPAKTDTSDPESPEPTEEEVADSTGETVTFEGGQGNTAAQQIPGGDYLARATSHDDCFVALDLVRPDESDRITDIPSAEGAGTTEEGYVYGLPAGSWFIEPITGGGCTWTLTLDPQ